MQEVLEEPLGFGNRIFHILVGYFQVFPEGVVGIGHQSGYIHW